MRAHRRDDHTRAEHLCHFVPAGDFQHLTRKERRTAGNALRPSLAIQVALMTNAGIKRPGLRGGIAVVCITPGKVVVPPVVGIATGSAVALRRVHLRVHVIRGLTVVVVTGADLLLHHVVVARHAPDRIHPL